MPHYAGLWAPVSATHVHCIACRQAVALSAVSLARSRRLHPTDWDRTPEEMGAGGRDGGGGGGREKRRRAESLPALLTGLSGTRGTIRGHPVVRQPHYENGDGKSCHEHRRRKGHLLLAVQSPAMPRKSSQHWSW